MSTKRILFDSSLVNINNQGGGSLAVLAYLNAVLQIFQNRVDVITASEFNIIDKRFISINVDKRSKYSKYFGIFQGKFYRSADYIVNYIKKYPKKYEYLFLNGGFHSGYIVKKLKQLNIKIIVFHHNYEPEYALGCKSIFSLYGRTTFWVSKWERKAYKYSTANLFISLQDQEIFEKNYGKRNNNYYMGIYEPNKNEIVEIVKSNENSIAITCSLCDAQNILSLRRFKENFLSIFHEILPDWELKIMGRNPSKEMMDWSIEHSYVKVFPNPENIRELCSKSPIYLCQMDDGGGLKLRIMDGLRNGQPILTHRNSARGYDVFYNEPFFKIYESDESFIQGLKDISKYIKSIDFSRKYIQKRYYEEFGFDMGVKRLQKILDLIE